MSEFEVLKTLTFEAAHRLPGVPAGHKCGRLHGHSFSATFVVRGPLHPEIGWVIDYGDIKAAVEPLVAELDHNYLNEVPGLENPTSEILARWLFERASVKVPGLYQVRVAETCTTESRFPVR